MNYKIDIAPRTFHFKQPAGTSRGTYLTRRSWMLTVISDMRPGLRGIGECAPLPDLSCDASPHYGHILKSVCSMVEQTGTLDMAALRPYPSMLFGLETALLNLQRGSDVLFDTPFGRGEEGIPINGLIWMGRFEEMRQRIEKKLNDGFGCVKLKIGAIDFEDEMQLIRLIRKRFGKENVELRVDANGAFSPDNALDRVERLAGYDIHSIEQPIRQHQWEAMARLCRESPLPIALDEELIGVNITGMKAELLDTIKPAFIVLKPSLHGGMSGTREWVDMARKRNIGTWITSALESNVGLNAISHLTARIYGPNISLPQGLGTGQLFTDNIPMNLVIKGDRLWYADNNI